MNENQNSAAPVSGPAHRIAFIGLGTIASDVCASLQQGGRVGRYIAGALTSGKSARQTASQPSCCRFGTLEDLLAWQPDLIVEAASQEAVWRLVPDCLRAGRPVLVTSVGALADAERFKVLQEAAAAGGAVLRVPAGAVASLDYLQALRGMADVSVVYESRKPPAAWQDELAQNGIAPETMTGPLVLFSGSAREAALRYPKNLNVAATVALACAGMDATQVSVVVDPAAQGNTHTITVRSPLGTLQTTLVNQPSPTNPKTSWVVAQSIVSAIERQFASFVVA